MDIVKRFSENPLIKPEDIKPSRDDLIVECIFNPGVFQYKEFIGLLCRVAERPKQKKNYLTIPVMNPFHRLKFLLFFHIIYQNNGHLQ